MQTFGDLIHWYQHIHAVVPDGVFTESGYTLVSSVKVSCIFLMYADYAQSNCGRKSVVSFIEHHQSEVIEKIL